MSKASFITALLLMGGQGARLGSSLPKQFLLLSGKPVYLHTLERFIRSNLFQEIILVCPQNFIKNVQASVAQYDLVKVVTGGATRKESSYIGLVNCSKETDYVVIHDAVRPFVTERILRENIENAILYKAVDTCIASADTLVHSEDANFISSIPNRQEYLRGQTPQSFAHELILDAHQKALEDSPANATDDCTLVRRLGHPIKIVQGDESNIKITTELDLFIAEQLLRLPSLATDELAQPHTSLKGKLFAVTGGTGDIGSTIISLLEQEGAKALSISKSSKEFPADLTSYADTKKVFDRIAASFGPLDGLINSIGDLQIKPFSSLSMKEIEHTIAANFTSVVFSCHTATLKSGSGILNIASSSYAKGRKGYVLYSAAKAALVNFSQGLAEEFVDKSVNVLVPQRTNTKMRAKHFPLEDDADLLSREVVARAAVNILRQHNLTGTIVEVKRTATHPCFG